MQVDPNPHRFKQLELASDFSELDRLRERIFHLLEDIKRGTYFYPVSTSLPVTPWNMATGWSGKKVLIELVITTTISREALRTRGGFNWRKHINNPWNSRGCRNRVAVLP